MSEPLEEFEDETADTINIAMSPRTLRQFFDKCDAEFEDDQDQLARNHFKKVRMAQGRWD